MYCQFYRLTERPFNVTADPAFFFASKKHKEAFSHLLYGVTQRKGIIVMTGEIGTGKTTLCRAFLAKLKNNVKTAFIINPLFSESQLLEAIVHDFGLKTKHKDKLSLVRQLNQFLLRQSADGKNVVIIIDEAQHLKPYHLELVRLLSNLETEKAKLLQIILVGQPELVETLRLPELRQLKQRISVHYHINPLDQTEVREYVDHRLSVAGPGHTVAFTDQAIKAITEFSSGTPRLINIVCDRALLCGFVEETEIIDLGIIQRCTQELELQLTQERINR